MEEKEEIKVKLSTVIYIFIIVALIIALGVTYYFGFVNDKKENSSIEDIANLNNNNILNVDSGIKENSTEENETVNNIEVDVAMENTEDIKNKCKKVFEEYLDINNDFGSGYSLNVLNKLGLISEMPNQEEYDVVRNDYGDYYKTDIKYEKFKNAMLNYVTEKYYKEYIEKTDVRNVNGYLQITADGGTATSFNIEKIELLNKDKNSYTFNIKGKFVADDSIESIGIRNVEATFEKQNNNYVVADISWDDLYGDY